MTDTQPSNTTAQSGGAPQAPAGQDGTGVDMQLLADKVYKLLLADARSGRARGDSPLVAQRAGEG